MPSGIVKSEKLIQRILNSLGAFREYAKSVFIVVGEYAKLFNRLPRMRQRSL
jgi:hypothetical protein